MKKDIHPENYRMVIFHDNSSEARFLVGSTIASSETDTWEDGVEYPRVNVDVSSDSHPFYTGQEKLVDIEGRVDKFKNRREAAQKTREAKNAKAAKAVKDVEAKEKADSEKKAEPHKIG
jgi:large subunit ribosomal protein L31